MTAQATAALKAGNQVRLDRGLIRRQIAVGPMFVSWKRCAAAIDEAPVALKTAEVGTVLRWCYKLDEKHLRMLLAATGIQSETRQVGELTDRQRSVLANGLRAFWEDGR